MRASNIQVSLLKFALGWMGLESQSVLILETRLVIVVGELCDVRRLMRCI
jgi:hypothetical protein